MQPLSQPLMLLRRSHPHPVAEKEMWLKTTVFAAGAITTYGAYVIVKEISHMGHEHEHGPAYPHMKVRRKAFPWDANQCDFFDLRA